MHRRLAALLTSVVVVLAAAGCGDARDHARQDFEPRTPGVLLVATALPAPGFWEGDTAATLDGGFEWDLAARLADRMGLELEVVDVPFAQIAAGDLAEADIAIAQISITDERTERFEFSQPYYTTDAGVLALAGEELDDLKSAREAVWAVVEGTTEADLVADEIEPTADVVVVADEAAATDAVLDGRADAALVDLPTALVIAGPDDRLAVIARVASEQRYAVALARDGRTARVNLGAVDAAIRAFESDGTLTDLADRWLQPRFGTDPADIPVIRIR